VLLVSPVRHYCRHVKYMGFKGYFSCSLQTIIAEDRLTAMSTVSAELVYFSPPPDGSRPFTSINADAKTGQRASNWLPEVHTVEIENVRGKESNYALGTAGFQYHTRPSKHATFVDDEEIRREYYPESIELIKQVTGASKVVLFDHSTYEIGTPHTLTLMCLDLISGQTPPSWRPRNGRKQASACRAGSCRPNPCLGYCSCASPSTCC
jgi:hypothetical protein